MKGSLIVLLMGRFSVRCKKFECRISIRMGTGDNPIDTANNALIYLFSEENVRVGRINRRYRVNLVTRAIRSHVQYLVYCVDREAMSVEFCERLLRYMN